MYVHTYLCVQTYVLEERVCLLTCTCKHVCGRTHVCMHVCMCVIAHMKLCMRDRDEPEDDEFLVFCPGICNT